MDTNSADGPLKLASCRTLKHFAVIVPTPSAAQLLRLISIFSTP